MLLEGICDMVLYINMGILIWVIICTSITAQGSGGSFKNRKPIGEVGCVVAVVVVWCNQCSLV